MASIKTEKLQALQDHYVLYNCNHNETEHALRKRTVKGGGIQFVKQCLRCGASTTNPVSREKALEMNGGIEPSPFDDQLAKQWRKEREDGTKRITGHFDNLSEFQRTEFHKWYSVYLESDEWKAKKAKVLARAKGICEGCMESPAEVVHHQTYKNVGAEFLFELLALCVECHNRYHENDEQEI